MTPGAMQLGVRLLGVGLGQLARRAPAGGDEAEVLRHAENLGVARREEEDMLDVREAPAQEVLVELPEGLGGGPLGAHLHAGLEGGGERRGPSRLPKPDPAAGRELRHPPARGPQDPRHEAVVAPARRGAEGPVAAPAALVQVHVSVEVGVEVEGEHEAVPVARHGAPEEGAHHRLVRVHERTPGEGVASQDGGHRHRSEAHGVELGHDALEGVAEVAACPELCDALRRDRGRLPPIAHLGEELELVADGEPHHVPGAQHYEQLLRPKPALPVQVLVACDLRAKKHLHAVLLHVRHHVFPGRRPVLFGPLGVPWLEEPQGLDPLVRVREGLRDGAGAGPEGGVVEAEALLRRLRHGPEVEVAGAPVAAGGRSVEPELVAADLQGAQGAAAAAALVVASQRGGALGVVEALRARGGAARGLLEGGGGGGGSGLGDLKVGSKVSGIIRKSMDYGCFVDVGLGRTDALLPKALMPEERTPASYKPGDTIDVYIANVDVQKNRVTLSVKEPTDAGPKMQQVGKGGLPQDDMFPDAKSWIAKQGGDEAIVDDEGIPWKDWEKKYPGLIKFPKKEVELYMTAQGYGFSGVNEAACAEPAYIPIPVHLRKPDAAQPEIPEFSFDDYELGYEYGIKPEIHTKYRMPPFNDPNWTFRPPQPQKGQKAAKK
mmetsp:Transcript_26425/g.78766  ORF Transcript_26425/g.78766 Transcript_26425/m.78766 type:complete len:661 (-) Transcript_26425:175-2157(-)